MGYFSDTMVLFEFKGDAEMAYANRRMYERGTGSHKAGASASRLAKHSVNSNTHETIDGDSYSYRGIKDIADDKSLGSSKKERLDSYSSKNKSSASEYHDRVDDLRNKYKGKSCKESFSEAFNSVVL